jgi:starch synthase
MPQGVPYKLLLAASEVTGFAKTGGLADVAAALPPALARRGHTCAIILPLYRSAATGRIPLHRTELTFTVPINCRSVPGRLWRATMPGSDVPAYLVEQPHYFERDEPPRGRGLYQFTLPNGEKSDYPDNCERFIFFCRAVLEAMRLLDYWPDVLHLNDWQTGLVPVYLREKYRLRRPPELGARYQKIRTLFTIHNIAYQGHFPPWAMPLARLDWKLFNYLQLEFYDRVNFLKAGLVFSDLLNTVSPNYAKEIQTPYFGWGLQGVLYERRDRLFGIVNGVDYRVWDPATDKRIAVTYDADTVTAGKPKCKAALQEHYGLEVRPRTPLLGMVSRLASQKGLDLLGPAAAGLLRNGTQMVVLGEGESRFHRLLRELRDRYPHQVGVSLAQDENLAHQIEAGADIFLMPSQFEPCGLSQLYSLKYGTVPVVRATGGLADTVVDCTPETLAAGTATGFAFRAYTADAFRETVERALTLYRDQPERWLELMRTGMRQDWSWDHSAAEYEQLFARLTAGRGDKNADFRL